MGTQLKNTIWQNIVKLVLELNYITFAHHNLKRQSGA